MYNIRDGNHLDFRKRTMGSINLIRKLKPSLWSWIQSWRHQFNFGPLARGTCSLIGSAPDGHSQPINTPLWLFSLRCCALWVPSVFVTCANKPHRRHPGRFCLKKGDKHQSWGWSLAVFVQWPSFQAKLKAGQQSGNESARLPLHSSGRAQTTPQRQLAAGGRLTGSRD